MRNPAGDIPPELRAIDALIRRAISDGEGRGRLARALLEPLVGRLPGRQQVGPPSRSERGGGSPSG